MSPSDLKIQHAHARESCGKLLDRGVRSYTRTVVGVRRTVVTNLPRRWELLCRAAGGYRVGAAWPAMVQGVRVGVMDKERTRSADNRAGGGGVDGWSAFP
jgi:hypothetical protein